MNANHFALFSLPVQFEIDTSHLEQQYRAMAARFHPDRFAAASSFEQKQAVMMSAALNEAYRVLNHPINRAAYLLELNGIYPDSPEHTAFPTDFLMQQMQWRESLFEIRDSQNQSLLDELSAEINEVEQALLSELNLAFVQNELDLAAELVRKGRFIHKIQQEIQGIRIDE